jgi:hypothetical protein
MLANKPHRKQMSNEAHAICSGTGGYDPGLLYRNARALGIMRIIPSGADLSPERRWVLDRGYAYL